MSVFIIGTGTDVGKTFVSALFVKHLKETGINAGYFKPVLSGTEKIDNELVCGDAKYVCNIVGIKEPHLNFVSYHFKSPVSPHLAAKIENTTINLNKIKNDFNNLKKKYDYLVVEGCGGIMCQISTQKNNEIFLTDIIKELNLDTILVASARLGTINSTFLTVEYAKKLNIKIKGIILNHYDKNNFMHIDNKKQIEYLTGIPVIDTVAENGRK